MKKIFRVFSIAIFLVCIFLNAAAQDLVRTTYLIPIDTVKFSPDGNHALFGLRDGRIILWDIASDYERTTFFGHSASASSIAFTPDGKQIISGSASLVEGMIKHWDIATGREIKTFSDYVGHVFSLAISPDGRQVLSASSNSSPILWDIATGQKIKSFLLDGVVFSVAFSPDGKQIVFGSQEGIIELRDIATNRAIRTSRDNQKV